MPTKQIPLYGEEGIFQQGDTVNGALAAYPLFMNGYFEKNSNPPSPARAYAFVKRPGLNTFVEGSAFTNNHKIQGIIGSLDRNTAVIYTNNGSVNRTWQIDLGAGGILTNVGVAPAAAGTWTVTGPVVFTFLDGISYGANNYYAVTDFNKGAVVANTGAWTEITDSDFTGLVKCTNFVALDGYLFIGTTNNRIYNSDLNTPGSWAATSFLTSADTPGSVIWLGRIRNYLIALKDRSIEFFEDVGNPAPGSPLEARKQLNRTIGCINKSTIQEVSDGIIFAGAANSQSPKLYKIAKDTLQITEISNRLVSRSLMRGFNASYSNDPVQFPSPSGATSQVFSIGSKEFYSITLPDPVISGGLFTHIWDNDLSIWTVWRSSTTTSGVNDAKGFVGCQAINGNFSSPNCTIFVNNSSSDSSHPPHLMAMNVDLDSSASLNWVDFAQDTVTANNYVFGWTSDSFDFGSRKRVFMDSLEVMYDVDSSVAPNFSANSYAIVLTYRDWDYNASSGYTGTKTMPIDIGSALRAICTRLGSFRRRNLSLSYIGPTALRIWGVEFDYNLGETEQDGE